MNATDHQISSWAIAATGLVWSQNVSMTHVLTGATILGATTVGALLPDVDHPNSVISKRLGIPLYKLFTHRGMTHSLLGWLIFSGLTYMLGNYVFSYFDLVNPLVHVSFCLWLGLSLGYFLHLLEDSWSRAGIRWLAPFTQFDKWSYYHYNTLLRKPVRWRKVGTKKIPIRHWWGRGYEVGSDYETFLTTVFAICGLIAMVTWIRRLL